MIDILKRIGATLMSYLLSIGLIILSVYFGAKFVPLLKYPILSQSGLVLLGALVFAPIESFFRSLALKYIFKA